MGDIADEHQGFIADDMERFESDPDYFGIYDVPSPRTFAAPRPSTKLSDFDDLTAPAPEQERFSRYAQASTRSRQLRGDRHAAPPPVKCEKCSQVVARRWSMATNQWEIYELDEPYAVTSKPHQCAGPEDISDLINTPTPAQRQPESDMRYNRFSNDELERAVYINPLNTAARDELIKRVPELIDEQSDKAADIQMQMDEAKKDHDFEIEDMDQELQQADATINSLRNELHEAQQQIARFTRAEDLV